MRKIFYQIGLIVLLLIQAFTAQSQTVSTKTNPNWESNNDWTGAAPTYTPSIDTELDHDSNINEDLIISGLVTINNGKTLESSKKIEVNSGGQLIIEGTVLLADDELIINANGEVIVRGSLEGTASSKKIIVEGNGILTVEAGGQINWEGDVEFKENGDVTIDGSVSIGGEFKNEACVDGDGNIYVENKNDVDNVSGKGCLFGCVLPGNGCCGISQFRSGAGCNLPDDPSPTTHTSIVTGDWTDASTWDTNLVPSNDDNVIIATGTTVTLDKGGTPEIFDFTIQSGGTFISVNKDVEIFGDYINNGIHEFSKKSVRLKGTGKSMSGTGIIGFTGNNDNAAFIVENDLSIPSGTELIIIGLLSTGGLIVNGTVNSQGKMQLVTKVTGTGTWENADGSDLFIYSNIFDIGLKADEIFNIVHFSAVGDQDVRVPTTGTYNALIIGGGGTKSLSGDITITFFLAINSALDVTTSNYDITIAGDIINKGVFNEQQGKVTLNGTSDQEIINELGGDIEFYDLEIDKTSGSLLLFSNIQVANELTLTEGNIKNTTTSTFDVTLGTSAANPGTLVPGNGFISSEFKRWINTTTITDPSGILFPVGSEESPYTITFKSDAVSITDGLLGVEFLDDNPLSNGLPLTESVGMVSKNYDNTFSEGYFTFDGSLGFSTTDYDLELDLSSFSSFPINSDETLTWRISSTNPWTLQGTFGTNDGTTATRTGITSGLGDVGLLTENSACTLPVPVVFSGGSTSVCVEETGVVYTVVDDINTDSYTWIVSGGSIVPDADATDNSITVDWGDEGIVGQIEVFGTNSCGDGPSSTEDVNIEPFITSSITGKTAVPQGQTGVSYEVDINPGYFYTWTITGGTQASGGNTNSITVDWGDGATGTISVVAATDNLGTCPDASAELLDISLFDTYVSRQDGNFFDGTTWIGGFAPGVNDNVFIAENTEVTLDADASVDVVIIDENAELNNVIYDLTVAKEYINNGQHVATLGLSNIILSSTDESPVIDGDGIITAENFTISQGNWILSENAQITITADNFIIDNSVLNVEGALLVGDDLSTANGGELLSSFVGSIVLYIANGNQTIYPAGDSYYNLGVFFGGTKTLTSDIRIDGDFSGVFIDAGGSISPGGNKISFTGVAPQLINFDFVTTFGDIEVNNNSGVVPALSVQENFSTDGTFTLTEGVVQTIPGKAITINSTGDITAGSIESYIDAPLAWDLTDDTRDYLFPVGEDGKYSPAEINIPSGKSGVFQVEYKATGLGDDSTNPPMDFIPSIVEYWQIDDISPIAGVDADYIRIYYNDAAFSGIIDETDLSIARYDGSDWTKSGWLTDPLQNGAGAGNTIFTGYAEARDIETFSPFTFASNSNPLPIRLTEFKGRYSNGSVILEWATSSETNNEYFEIQHSHDGEEFITIGKVEGNGTSLDINRYAFTDRYPLPDLNYYRLKQFDFDGEYEYTKIISVLGNGEGGFKVSLHPVPAQDYVNLTLRSESSDIPVEMDVIDSQGRKVLSQNLLIGARENRLNISSLTDGLYFVVLKQGNYRTTEKLIVNR